MDRGTTLLGICGIVGLLIGGYLGLMTERGFIGLVTVVGAILGMGVGIYIGQAMISGEDS